MNFSPVTKLISALCDVMHAHAEALTRGVLHQDISINNIMLYWISLLFTSYPLPTMDRALSAKQPDTQSSTPTPTFPEDVKDGATPPANLRNGLPINFDYAMYTNGQTFTFKGRGTLPFISYHILKILERNASGHQEKQIVDHRPEDDLESLFYVLLRICILYDEPDNSPRTDIPFQELTSNITSYFKYLVPYLLW
ncbi:hypothetical protein BDN67DRAFT_1015961 [Paxillus ammoniavirescens]|nr:hypothetical protein BDN67DRAFT_1015961 [Paxillus ammoniavirescens]